MEDVLSAVELQSWDDDKALSWEPVRSTFLALRESGLRGKSLESHQIILAKELIGHGRPGWRKVIQSWLDLTFQDGRRKRVTLSSKTATLFIQCFWELGFENKNAARKLISDARQVAGYSNKLWRPDETVETGTKRSPSDGSDLPPKKRHRNTKKPVMLPTPAPSPPQVISPASDWCLPSPPTLSVSPSRTSDNSLTPDRLPLPTPAPSISRPYTAASENFLGPPTSLHRPATPISPSPNSTEDRGLRTSLVISHLSPPAMVAYFAQSSQYPNTWPNQEEPPELSYPPAQEMGTTATSPPTEVVKQEDSPASHLFSTAMLVDSKLDPDISMLPPEPSSQVPLMPQTLSPPVWSPKDSIPNKIPLPFLPPIWAKSRQEVCESTNWFKSYQGGVYHSGGRAKGYLLGGFPSFRDTFLQGGKLIISHGGGKSDSIHTTKGQMHRCTDDDQLAQDKSVRALLGNYESKTPLVLLIDDKYAFFPYDLASKDVAYAVLGVYMITYAWVEYDPSKTNEKGKVMRYKFAFQWCEGQGDPWWHADGSLEKNMKQSDIKCDPTMFENKTVSTLVPTPIHLTAGQTMAVDMRDVKMELIDSASTLLTQEPSPGIGVMDLKFLLRPIEQDSVDSSPPPYTDSGGQGSVVVQYCATCRQPSSQIYEPEWTCLQPQCAMFWKTTLGLDYVPKGFHPGFTQLSSNVQLDKNDALTDIRPRLPKTDSDNPTSSIFLRGWHCQKCGRLSCRSKWECWQCERCGTQLPSEMKIQELSGLRNSKVSSRLSDGFIIHPASNIARHQTVLWNYPSGLDWTGSCTTYILPNDIGQIHHIQGSKFDETANQIFHDYQKQANEEAIKFRRWPLRAHKCRGQLLTNYFSQNCGEPYHYVGGTDNTVPFDKAGAAVSNARQLIQDRIRQALRREELFNEILSAAYMESQKMAFHSDAERGLGPVVAGLSLGSPAVMHFRPIKTAKSEERRTIALSIVLRHGDVLVMDGEKIQHRYQHTVVPTDFRIAATARFINPGHAPPSSVEKSSVPLQLA